MTPPEYQRSASPRRAAPAGPRIVVTESQGFCPQALDHLGQIGPVELADVNRQELLSAIATAEVLWVRLRHFIGAEVLAAAPHLKMILTATTGLNHIDLDACAARGVRVLSLQGAADFLKDIRATAEHTLGLMLALLRHIPAATRDVVRGGWNRDQFQGRELFGKTIGIVGYGRLGRIVARYLTAFGAQVLATDPKNNASEVDPCVTFAPLSRLLEESHLVSLHVNLCAATRGFFGAAEFEKMRAGAWFINTSRGELIDEPALLDALRRNRLAGAALDVLAGEDGLGASSHPLIEYARQHDHLLITPHIGGCTRESMRKTEQWLAERFQEIWLAQPALPTGDNAIH